MKPTVNDMLKASFTMLAGWVFAIWMLFLLISSIALIR
jgi:hypothetical protein